MALGGYSRAGQGWVGRGIQGAVGFGWVTV